MYIVVGFNGKVIIGNARVFFENPREVSFGPFQWAIAWRASRSPTIRPWTTRPIAVKKVGDLGCLPLNGKIIDIFSFITVIC